VDEWIEEGVLKRLGCGFVLTSFVQGQYGGELGVDLPSTMSTGNGFSLIFMDTKSGEVYYKVRRHVLAQFRSC
jgi:hypothetical protein